jgi:hypothetical protein
LRTWLRSAQLILDNGNPHVILCERGIRTFETAMRNTFDVAAIALLKQISHLPVIADPSHAAGHRELVPALARIAVAAGADGLLVEVHPNPDKAWSDGEQSLDFAGFDAMMYGLEPWLELRGQELVRREGQARSRWRRWDEGFCPDACGGRGCGLDSRFAGLVRLRSARARQPDADVIVTAAPVYVPLAALEGRRAISQGRAVAADSRGQGGAAGDGICGDGGCECRVRWQDGAVCGQAGRGRCVADMGDDAGGSGVRKVIAGEGMRFGRSICLVGGWFMRGTLRRDFGLEAAGKDGGSLRCADRCAGRVQRCCR